MLAMLHPPQLWYMWFRSGVRLLAMCRDLDGMSYAEEVLVTKSELEEKKQRMSELETQASCICPSLCLSEPDLATYDMTQA